MQFPWVLSRVSREQSPAPASLLPPVRYLWTVVMCPHVPFLCKEITATSIRPNPRAPLDPCSLLATLAVLGFPGSVLLATSVFPMGAALATALECSLQLPGDPRGRRVQNPGELVPAPSRAKLSLDVPHGRSWG